MFVRLRGEIMLLRATEAREESFKIVEEERRKEIQKIEEAIQSAIEQGYFNIEIDGVVDHTTRSKLEKLGYKIEIRNHYNECFTKIGW